MSSKATTKVKTKEQRKKIELKDKNPHALNHGFFWKFFVVLLTIAFSIANALWLHKLFENDRHFSHLADFEREMSYRTEMGLYFSYYKTLINAPSFLIGLHEITSDNVTEYGHTINTLKRFNLYPEVTLGFLYRLYKQITNSLNIRTESCYQIGRGPNYSPVTSCVGMGNSHYFYINFVFAIAGTVAGSLFLFGTVISDSILGGLLTVLMFAFNHGESTRVQWTPPLRESFSYPFIVAQMVLATYILRTRQSGRHWILLIIALCVPSLLSWQFAQFYFFTQIASIFAVHALDYAPIETTRLLVMGHLISCLISFILLFGNEMLVTSIYVSAIFSFSALIILHKLLNKIQFRPLFVLLEVIIFLGLTFGFKYGSSKMLNVEDDAHIFEILKSKFSDFANFHTRLYTCAAEFDFFPIQTFNKLCKSCLIPFGVCLPIMFLTKLLFKESLLWRSADTQSKNPEVAYNTFQLLCGCVMAYLIMRLKLFLTPHLAATSAFLLSEKLHVDLFGRRFNFILKSSIFVALISAAAYNGLTAIKQQQSIMGEYSNPHQELLFEWINTNTPKNAVFAGTMPVMANVKLSTLRPIVNHPHYEDVGIRTRTLKVYSMFSKKPLKTVYRDLKKMGVQYFIFQLMNCAPHHARKECSYREMWDLQDPANIGQRSLCDLWEEVLYSHAHTNIDPFRIVYNQHGYTVFKL